MSNQYFVVNNYVLASAVNVLSLHDPYDEAFLFCISALQGPPGVFVHARAGSSAWVAKHLSTTGIAAAKCIITWDGTSVGWDKLAAPKPKSFSQDTQHADGYKYLAGLGLTRSPAAELSLHLRT